MAVIQRPVKGSRISSFYPVHDLPSLASLDSAFQLQEYISLLIRLNVHDVDAIVSLPGKSGSHERDLNDGGAEKDTAEKEGKGEVTVEESCWVYEQLRRLAQDLSHPLITTLQQECTRQTCPEMKAGEWLYLCVAHGNEGAMEQCCAIDYILHTLDSATALLNSPRAFPSRLSIPPASTRHFSSLARRLGRIFAHAYYHHREAFEQAEAESSLYARFLALTSKFALVPSEFLVIPPRMSIQVHSRGEEERDEGPETAEEAEESPIDLDASEYMNTARRIHGQERLWLDPTAEDRNSSPPGPAGDARNPSPRKGRSRTDTMVYSEAINLAEELARSHGLQEAELDREVAQERLSAYDSSEVVLEDPPASSRKLHFEDFSAAPVPQISDMSLSELSAQDTEMEEPSPEPSADVNPAGEDTAEDIDEKEEEAKTEDVEMVDQTAESAEPPEEAEGGSEESSSAEAESHPQDVQEVDVTESTEHSKPPSQAEPEAEPAATEETVHDTEDLKSDDPEDAVEGKAADSIEPPVAEEESHEKPSEEPSHLVASSEVESAPTTDDTEAEEGPK